LALTIVFTFGLRSTSTTSVEARHGSRYTPHDSHTPELHEPMKRDYIDFVDWREIPQPFIPRKWWDKIRWRLVKWLGGVNPLDTVEVKRVPVNGKEFMERLWKQKRALVESFRREPTTVLMGAEDYEELMSSPAVRQSFTVHAEFNYGRREVYGLTVKVIPWMRGILVMP
jgi:hypothetical protein